LIPKTNTFRQGITLRRGLSEGGTSTHHLLKIRDESSKSYRLFELEKILQFSLSFRSF